MGKRFIHQKAVLKKSPTMQHRGNLFFKYKEQLKGIESKLASANIQLGISEEKNRRNDREVMFKEIMPEIFWY